MGLAKPDNDLVAIRWRAAWLRLERYDRPKIRPGHSLSDLAGGALGRDPLVLRADDHDIQLPAGGALRAPGPGWPRLAMSHER